MPDEKLLRDQYRTSVNLNARTQLHERFSTNPRGWFAWYMDQLDLPPNSHILEIGCGPAFLWQATRDRRPPTWKLTLTDYSIGMVLEARQALHTPFCFASVDAQSIPFPNSSFDAVLANHMLYHVPDKARAIAEIRRVLRPQGRLFAATNGERHMLGLHDITMRLAPDLDSRALVPGLWARSFTLENGPAQLAQSFAQVETRRYPDSLQITEARPLLDYMLSMINSAANPPSLERVQHFQEQIEREIEEKGVISIPKDTGLLIASL